MLAERLRRKIETTSVRWKNQQLTVHASFGVACWPAARASAAKDLVTLADKALYAAKESGRNRVFVDDGATVRQGEIKGS